MSALLGGGGAPAPAPAPAAAPAPHGAPAVLPTLEALLQVETLDLASTNLGDNGLQGFADMLRGLAEGQGLPQLRGLILNNNNLSHFGITALITALRPITMPNLELLSLGGNKQIGHEGMRALARIIPSCLPNLKTLKLGDTGMAVGISAFAEMVQQHPTALLHLEVLHLGYNNLRSEGMTRLCNVLMACPHIKALHLGYNYIEEAGGRALTDMIRNHPHVLSELEDLELKGNNMLGGGGLQALAEVLTVNPVVLPSLQKLHLRCTGTSDAALVAFAGVLTANPAVLRDLQELSLEDNRDIGSRGIFHLTTILEVQPTEAQPVVALQNLRSMWLRGTRITGTNLERLKVARPTTVFEM